MANLLRVAPRVIFLCFIVSSCSAGRIRGTGSTGSTGPAEVRESSTFGGNVAEKMSDLSKIPVEKSNFQSDLAKEQHIIVDMFCHLMPSSKPCLAMSRGITADKLCKKDGSLAFVASPPLSDVEKNSCLNCVDQPPCTSYGSDDLEKKCKFEPTSMMCPISCGLARCGGSGFPLKNHHVEHGHELQFDAYLHHTNSGLQSWIESGERIVTKLKEKVKEIESAGSEGADIARAALTTMLDVWSSGKAEALQIISDFRITLENYCSLSLHCHATGTKMVFGQKSSGCKCECARGYTGARCDQKLPCNKLLDCGTDDKVYAVVGSVADGCVCKCNTDYEGPKCQTQKPKRPQGGKNCSPTNSECCDLFADGVCSRNECGHFSKFCRATCGKCS